LKEKWGEKFEIQTEIFGFFLQLLLKKSKNIKETTLIGPAKVWKCKKLLRPCRLKAYFNDRF